MSPRARAVGIAVLVAVVLLLQVPRLFDPRRDETPASAYPELARFANQRTRAQIQAALALVDPEGRLAPYYRLDDATLSIAREAGGAPVVSIALRAQPLPQTRLVPRRIALDPGHFGGAWSRRERRHVERARPVGGGGVAADGGPRGDGGAGQGAKGGIVKEGDLAWATARLLDGLLRARGIDVVFTRGAPPLDDFPAGADPAFDPVGEAGMRIAEQYPRDRMHWSPFAPAAIWWAGWAQPRRERFELYQRYDLRRRSALAADAAADLTLSLHWDATTSDQNGTLVFMPGNFVGEDLATAHQRLWAFMRVLDGSLAEAERLGRHFAVALMDKFDLPALTAAHDFETGHVWRPIDEGRGLYARNLAILRRTPGVALLLEGPCVNQTDEYPRLIRREIEVDGRLYPARVRQYADAVLAALDAAAAP